VVITPKRDWIVIFWDFFTTLFTAFCGITTPSVQMTDQAESYPPDSSTKTVKSVVDGLVERLFYPPVRGMVWVIT